MAWCWRGVSGAWPYLEGDGVRKEFVCLIGVENIADAGSMMRWYRSDLHLNGMRLSKRTMESVTSTRYANKQRRERNGRR
jgi:hypothetical protein